MPWLALGQRGYSTVSETVSVRSYGVVTNVIELNIRVSGKITFDEAWKIAKQEVQKLIFDIPNTPVSERVAISDLKYALDETWITAIATVVYSVPGGIGSIRYIAEKEV